MNIDWTVSGCTVLYHDSSWLIIHTLIWVVIAKSHSEVEVMGVRILWVILDTISNSFFSLLDTNRNVLPFGKNKTSKKYSLKLYNKFV